jgi:hypothetical protein
MNPARRVVLLAALLWVGQVSGLSQTKPLELRWNELAAMIAGHTVELTLTNATFVRGEAVAVREDMLIMDISKTSMTSGYQKGNGVIPRSAIDLIRLDRTRGSWGRTLGTVVGVLTGMAIGGWTAAAHTNSAGAAIPTFLGITAGISVAGYYAGREIDRKATLIRVVP